MTSRVVYFWKKAPFIRILLPLIAGIIIQWYFENPLFTWLLLGLFCIASLFLLFSISLFRRFKLSWLDGIIFIGLFISIGALLTWFNDIRHNKRWFLNYYSDKTAMMVSLDEPLTEKSKSWKATANVDYILDGDKTIKVKGKIILYFKKEVADSHGLKIILPLEYGSRIIFKKSLQEIRDAGNPGGFDYKRYCLVQQITHQVYLKTGEFEILGEMQTPDIKSVLYSFRDKLLKIFRNNIRDEKELGLAEALLIGYKDDLDKSMVQSYSNTGVVHIIAISGMHLALIYWLLNILLSPLGKNKKWRWMKPVVAISLLWGFSLLTGGSASVMRAAVMFTFIVAADSLSKKVSVYNTLAASAFCLLCYNPYWLWDVGFQLSYAAVLSIVIFMKPIYNLIYIKNKLLDHIWQLNAVTLAAQILTTPLSIYHFHQFPVYFFLTNLIAVPLSSVIVLGEILLCAISIIPAIALTIGKILSWLILLMNSYVERIEALPGSLWDGMQISVAQSVLLYVIVGGLSFWLLEKLKPGLIVALITLAGFLIIRSSSFISAQQQQKIIVYNVPQRRAIDFISGRGYFFCGDMDLVTDDFTRNFHLKPSRVLNRVTAVTSSGDMHISGPFINYKGKRVLLLYSDFSFSRKAGKFALDLVIVSKNPKLYITQLVNSFNVKQIVFDGSVSSWKLAYWKKDCDSLHVPYYDVSEKGAFVMNVN